MIQFSNWRVPVFHGIRNFNTGYYTLEFSPQSCNLATIVTEFGKFRYNRVPIGICNSGDTFQAKVDGILGDIEGFKTYINNIMVLNKGILSKHIDHIIFIFARLHSSGLKTNPPNEDLG